MKWRILSVISVFGLLYSFLIYNAYNLQFNKRNYYLTLARARDELNGSLSIPRGNIYFTDKNDNAIPAVLNKDYPVIYAVPTEIQKSLSASSSDFSASIHSVAEKVAAAIGLPTDELVRRFTKKKDDYELLIVKAAPEEVGRIQSENIKGIYVKNRPFRYYPFGDMASHLLGFVSPANETESLSIGNVEVGRYGLELYFNRELSGASAEGRSNAAVGEENGGDLYLTIDRNIQGEAEEILKKLISNYNASGGTVIVEEPMTGKILVMASSPDFNPNNYSKYNIGSFLNPAVEAVYEPGSIFKLITMSAGIDSGKITPETTYYDTGSFTANHKTITNWDFKKHGAYGRTTMTDVIEHSINTGAVFAEKQTGNDIFYNYLVKFGINDLTGITLPGEVRGNINNLKRGKEIDFATAAYGQGVSVTPLGLINAISAIANGGLLMKPYVLTSDKPLVIRRVISAETAKEVVEMMVSAVRLNKIADVPGYSIAGKTGTAFIPIFGGRGYSNEVINTYIGFAPASNPKFIVLIKLDKPVGSPLAGESVVPAFKEMSQFLLNYYEIPPDNLPAGQ